MTKKVDSKAALRRAWRFVKVKGLDKQTAFDLAWKMERGELPKRTTAQGNQVIRVVDYSVLETVSALKEIAKKYKRYSQITGMTMDEYKSPKQRAGYGAQYKIMVNRIAKILNDNGLVYSFVDDKYTDMDDDQVQVVFVK